MEFRYQVVQIPEASGPLGEVRFFFGAGLPLPILYLVLFAEHETFFGLGLWEPKKAGRRGKKITILEARLDFIRWWLEKWIGLIWCLITWTWEDPIWFFYFSFQMHQKKKPKLKSTEVLADSVDCLGGLCAHQFSATALWAGRKKACLRVI